LDFSSALSGGNTVSANDEYLHIVFLPNYGDHSNGINDEIFHFDNFSGPVGTATTPDPTPVNMLNDFDGTSVCVLVETMGNPAPDFHIVNNPAGGSNQVFEFVKPVASGWGNWDRIHFELNEAIEVIGGKAAFSIKAYSPASKGFLLKIADDRDSDNAPNKAEIWQDVTEINTWQTLEYVFTGLKDAEYKHVFIYPAGGDGDLNSYYIDDLKGPKLKTATFIGETFNGEMTVYPNPVNDILHIKGIVNETPINVYSASGALVKQVRIKNGSIDVMDLNRGVYFIRIGDVVSKFIKK